MTNKSVNDVAITDAGQAYKVKFGTVLEQHPVNIKSSPDIGVARGLCLALVQGRNSAIQAHRRSRAC